MAQFGARSPSARRPTAHTVRGAVPQHRQPVWSTSRSCWSRSVPQRVITWSSPGRKWQELTGNVAQHKLLLLRTNSHQQATPGNARTAIAPDSKSGGGDIVLVRVRPGAPTPDIDRSAGGGAVATGGDAAAVAAEAASLKRNVESAIKNIKDPQIQTTLATLYRKAGKDVDASLSRATHPIRSCIAGEQPGSSQGS
jgi:hypothetical protein